MPRGVVGIQYLENYLKLHSIEIIEKEFPNEKLKGLYVDHIVILSPGLTETEKICILAEELGHHATCKGNIINRSIPRNNDQEHAARFWACERLITFRRLEKSCCCTWKDKQELADCWGISCDFLDVACDVFRKEYGCELLDSDLDNNVCLNIMSISNAWLQRLELST